MIFMKEYLEPARSPHLLGVAREVLRKGGIEVWQRVLKVRDNKKGREQIAELKASLGGNFEFIRCNYYGGNLYSNGVEDIVIIYDGASETVEVRRKVS
jgi:hypothetical protein